MADHVRERKNEEEIAWRPARLSDDPMRNCNQLRRDWKCLAGRKIVEKTRENGVEERT
ncbi:hypothetical protein SESBI_36950 [Sesbania bispinosa]|nr:hypothetical protein SESBI_36950 [Sesbania bispinosa]